MQYSLDCPASSLQPLQRLIRAAARYVADLGPFDSVSGTLKELHWLPIEQRIEHKLCLLMHSVVGNVAPSYLNDMVTRVADLPGHACFEISRIWSFWHSSIKDRLWISSFLDCWSADVEQSSIRNSPIFLLGMLLKNTWKHLCLKSFSIINQ